VVVGMLRGVNTEGIEPSSPTLHYAFMSGRGHALSLILSDEGPSALSDVACDACVSDVASLLRTRCDLRTIGAAGLGGAGPAGGGAGVRESSPSRAVLSWVLEALAPAWPSGYRLADRCDGLAELTGLLDEPEGSGALAMCAAYGCAAVP
jgi:hypothetical protein